MSSFVVESDSGKITDMGSYYHLPSSVMRNPKHDKLNAAYSFYNVATSVSFKDLMNDMLIVANNVRNKCKNIIHLIFFTNYMVHCFLGGARCV